MATKLDDRPEVADTQTGNDEVVFHYVDKSKIAESAVLGSTVVALCGYEFPVTRSPKPGSPVCGVCKELYAQRVGA